MKASVIIPAYNSEKTIRKCLESILAQNLGQAFEIIVVDDGSSDRTKEIVKQFAKKDKDIKLLEQNHAGPAVARNLGAKTAKGEIIVFTDSDCETEKNWLKEMLSPFSDKKVVGVQGAYKTKQKGLIANFVQLEVEERYERMKIAKCLDWIGSYSAAYKKDIYLKTGGFDTCFEIASGEDPDLSYRIAEEGYKLEFNPNAIVYHQHVDSLLKYLEKKFGHAYWRVTLYSKHKSKMVKDSYTPQKLKLQLLFLAIFLGTSILSMFSKGFGQIADVSILLAIILMLPTVVFMLGKNQEIGIISLPILLLRDFAMLFGLIFGILEKKSK